MRKFEKLCEGDGRYKKKKGNILLRLPFRGIVLHSVFRNYFDGAHVLARHLLSFEHDIHIACSNICKKEKSIITDVESARELIEIIESKGDTYDDRKVNALVSFFRSRKNEMGWHKVIDILVNYDYDEASLWNDVERKRLWEKQSTI